MAALVEGQQYGLSSLAATSADKTVVHVKLTDSALRAIEEFQKIKEVTSRRPTIQFSDSHGVVRVPIKKSSDNPEGTKPFQFTVSCIQGDPKGSFESVQQFSRVRGEERLMLLGSMSHKMQFQANDDVYRSTKESMNRAEEEVKKQCAKEIKPGGPFNGRKIKKVVKNNTIKLPSSTTSNHSAIAVNHVKPYHRPEVKQIIQNNHRTLPQGTTTTSSSSLSPSSSKSSSLSPSTHSNSSKSSSGYHSSSSHSSRIHGNSAMLNMPYRDRVIHLLALRPYKKPELLARLHKDGIREKDKNSLSSTLQQVGVFNTRDNSFTLAKHLFAEVKPDWPFYSDQDKQLLKRRMPQETPNSASNSPSPVPSPAYSNSSQGSPTSSQKRPSSTTEPEYQPTKKQRIAHERRDNKVDVSKKHMPESDNKVDSKKHMPESDNKVDSSKKHLSEIVIRREATTTTPDSNHNNIPADGKYNKSPTESYPTSTSDSPDFVMKYMRITNTDQRHKYKTDFNSEYDEYRQLHANVEKVTKRFKKLESELKDAQENTEHYENIKNRILTEYKALKKDPKFVKKKKVPTATLR